MSEIKDLPIGARFTASDGTPLIVVADAESDGCANCRWRNAHCLGIIRPYCDADARSDETEVHFEEDPNDDE